MAIPSSYTEDTLKTYMLTVLKELGAVLGLTTSSFDEAVNEALLAYGVDDIANATNMPKLRALARVEAWTVAVTAAGSRIDWSEAGASFKQSGYKDSAREGLALAQAAAVQYGGGMAGNVVTVGSMSMNDPYAACDEEWAESA